MVPASAPECHSDLRSGGIFHAIIEIIEINETVEMNVAPLGIRREWFSSLLKGDINDPILISSRITNETRSMAAVTIRNLSEETHRALKIRAAQHNRSTEAEIRAILESAVRPEGRLRLGTALAEMSRKIGVTDADVDALGEALGEANDGTPAQPLRLR